MRIARTVLPGETSIERAVSVHLTDQLVRTLTPGGDINVVGLVATNLVREATSLRVMSPTAMNALGRTLMGAVLLGTGMKGDETLQLQLRGDGPLGEVLAIAESTARVRGTVRHPTADVPPRDGHFDVAAGIGEGMLAVVRHHPRWREPHTGVVALESGEVAKDLARYLSESEQTPAAVGLAMGLDRDGAVDAAGGFLVRALPGASDEVFAAVDANVHTLPNAADLVRIGFDANAIVDHLVEGIGSGERHAALPEFFCPCSRQRALDVLALLGADEIEEILSDGESQEVCCHFCGEAYRLSSDELHERFAV